MTPIALTPLDLALAAILVLLEAGFSVILGLGLHRQVLVAAARMVVQLLLVGYALRLIFALASPAATLAAIVLMVLVAAREVAARPDQRLRRYGNELVALVTVAGTTGLTAILALTTAIRPHPWWEPQYAIPLGGIILGTVLNSATLTLDYILSTVTRDRSPIEARLALGHSFREATRPILRAAIRRGVLPIINQMSAAGVIVLPGIMTGQILAGLDPLEAVKYQILLMFLLAGSSVLGAFLTATLALRRLTDDRARLRLDWVKN